MKHSLIVFILCLGSAVFSNELAWVDEQVEAIKPPRSGVSDKLLSATQDPFVLLQKVDKEQSKTLLSAGSKTTSSTSKVKPKKRALKLWLVVNDSAKINNKWYKKGDMVSGYKIKRLDSKSVFLKKHTKLKFNKK